MAFANCFALTEIELPDGLETMGSYAFSSCRGLTSVLLPDTLTAFADCKKLTTVKISVTNTSTEAGKTYYYRVKAILSKNTDANSEASTAKSVAVS